jgi:lipopolysaccharide transport system ATP-binding protein
VSAAVDVMAPDIVVPEIVVDVRGLGKFHKLYARHGDRVKQLLAGRRKRYYREFWALRNVNLQLLRGEMLGVIGENGAGKSTLLHLICSTLHPSEGEVHTHGRLAAMLELGAGFNREFTGRENVLLNAAVLGLTQKEIAERFESIAAFADIGRFMDLPVKTYSSGMYARLAFAICAHVDADILIVDEILGVGDAAFQQKCMRFLRQFCEHGTLLFVSHDSGLVAQLCQRALWLERGEVRGLGPAEEVCARYLQSKSNARETAFQTRVAATLDRGPLLRDVRGARVGRIAVSDFDSDAPWHGHGGARIIDTGFYATSGARLTEIVAGEEVELRITARAERPVARPIMGFILRDHLGQTVVGDNSFYAYRDAPLAVPEGRGFSAAFRFQFPYLAKGVYTLAPSINEGTQADHVQLHWIEDGLVLEVTQSPVSLGIVGVMARQIAIEPL